MHCIFASRNNDPNDCKPNEIEGLFFNKVVCNT